MQLLYHNQKMVLFHDMACYMTSIDVCTVVQAGSLPCRKACQIVQNMKMSSATSTISMMTNTLSLSSVSSCCMLSTAWHLESSRAVLPHCNAPYKHMQSNSNSATYSDVVHVACAWMFRVGSPACLVLIPMAN